MSNIPWITVIHRSEGTILVEHKQAYGSILPSTRSFQQVPIFVGFVGKNAKAATLRHIFAASNEAVPVEHHGQIRLWSDPSGRKADHPMVYVDCELHNHSSSRLRDSYQPEPGVQRKLVTMQPWYGPPSHRRQRQLGYKLYAQALAPFMSVICVFASDMGGLRGVSEMLAGQAVLPSPSCSTPPQVLIVCSAARTADGNMDAKMRQMVLQEMRHAKSYRTDRTADEDLDETFSGIRVLALGSASRAHSDAGFLQSTIRSEVERVQAVRAKDHTLFSFHHFQAFLSAALEHFAAGVAEPFHFFRAARAHNPPSAEFADHLLELVRKLPDDAALGRVAVPLVAAATTLDSSPPGMHHFAADRVFDEFYLSTCAAVWCNSPAWETSRAHFSNAVRAEYLRLHSTYDCSPRRWSASQLHRDTFQLIHHDLKSIISHKTCLSCLMRAPEKVLTCGHAICDVCVKIFGASTHSERYTFILTACPICGMSNEGSPVYRLLGPTCGMRILCLDGGGVKGVIPLVFLRHINERLKPLGRPLQDYFDFVCGTSSGGLVVLGLFMMQWSPDQCLRMFEDLAGKVFQRRSSGSLLFSKLQELVLSYLADSKYDSKNIDAALHAAFGGLRMFNPIKSDIKIAVTATTARGAFPCLFTNYNGGPRPADNGYHVVRAAEPEDDISVSEAARCSSAAPWFFKPKNVRNLGTYQDGGLRHNNPYKMALWESKFIRPEKEGPDFLLSLGTGMTPATTSIFKVGPGSPVRDGFAVRLFKTFMSGLDGENAWQEHATLQPQKTGIFHRLNLTLGAEVGIDDVTAMQRLKAAAAAQIETAAATTSIIDSCYASAFYFELDGPPQETNGYFLCVGHIYCRLNLDHAGREFLYQKLIETSAYFLIDGQPTFCVDRVPKCVPPYRRAVRFSIPTLDANIHITIRNVTSETRVISGLPATARALMKAQMLDMPFGRVDHVRPEKMLPDLPSKRGRS